MYIGLGLVSSTTFYLYCRRENAIRERGGRDEVIEGVLRPGESKEEREARAKRNGYFGSAEEAKREKGDEWSGYRYTL